MRRVEILEVAAKLFSSSGFRASLQELAEACGILPGSLYHHFESKEAIIVELIRRYQTELDLVAERALDDLHHGAPIPPLQRITTLAEAIVACATHHRAALLQTLYEPPLSASKELMQVATQTPRTVDQAMLEILRAGRASNYIRSDIDLARFAEQICQSMLHTGVGTFHCRPGGQQIPALKCRMLLEGLAVKTEDPAKLDRSQAFAAAEKVIAGWRDQREEGRMAVLEAAARAEFGRRGYEGTTIRDIASAAGMNVGAVYRLAGSKEQLLDLIMATFIEQVSVCWDAVMASKSTPVEKLDALAWVGINMLERFSEEVRIQVAWLRESPPAALSNFADLKKRLRYMRALLTEGEGAGYFTVPGGTLTIRANCLIELTTMSEHLVRNAGTRASLALARQTLICGAATRSERR